jgi:hypothetical protein
MKAFVLGVRAIEKILGVRCEGNSGLVEAMVDPIARPAFIAALPIINKLSRKYNIRPKGFGLEALVNLDLSTTAKVEASVGLFLNAKSDKQCIFTQCVESSH